MLTGNPAQRRDALADRIFNDPSSWNAGSKDNITVSDMIDQFPAVPCGPWPDSARASKFSLFNRPPEMQKAAQANTEPIPFPSCSPPANKAPVPRVPETSSGASRSGRASTPTSPAAANAPLVLLYDPSLASVSPITATARTTTTQALRVPSHPSLPPSPIPLDTEKSLPATPDVSDAAPMPVVVMPQGLSRSRPSSVRPLPRIPQAPVPSCEPRTRTTSMVRILPPTPLKATPLA